MLIFGHNLIPMQKFFHFKDKFDKKSINCFDFNERIIQQALEQNVEFAIYVNNEDEVLLANALGAKYALVVDSELARRSSKMAEFYMFDMKILFLLDEIKNLKKMYELQVDGVCLISYINNKEV
ncbi:Uncharacterised protein [Campylobacter insulaenigrae]|uniref:hypothetical protein n=2 Tax=Campylobacter insulaenigrae TaxID=260714 RepID=UPI000F6FC319|nr:hypothetical protein [Campylobacter insulaenigrae]VEJ54612.1 Uncharacterised protein [Campylobacter insulaenigrae]